MVAERLAVHLEGQASKRGLIPRMPAGERLLADAATWLTTEYGDIVRSTAQHTLPTGDTRLTVALHPAAPDLVLTASDTGRVTADASTTACGPGYHRFVGRVIERMGLELGIGWTPDAIAFAERPVVERAYLAWLGPMLTHAQVARQRGRPGLHVGTPPGTTFAFDGAIATALGPRDDAWLDSAIAEPRIAIEVTPWWADATDGRYLLNRALAMLWLEVRWRPPAIDGEADLLDDVHRSLSRAFPVEPDLDYPWHAWVELAALRAPALNDAMIRQAATRATATPEPTPPVGYRRGDVRISHEGWALEVPGSFAEKRTEEEWWGGGPGRGITLAAVTTATPTGPMSAEAFVREFAARSRV